MKEYLSDGWGPRSRPARIDAAESRRVARAIKARQKECWRNAYRAILTLDEYADASYVEGHVVTKSGMSFEHGWVVLADTIIDPTLPDRIGVYFPGLEFCGRAGIADFLALMPQIEDEEPPFFYAFGWGGENSPSYSASCEASLAFVRLVHIEQHDPNSPSVRELIERSHGLLVA